MCQKMLFNFFILIFCILHTNFYEYLFNSSASVSQISNTNYSLQGLTLQQYDFYINQVQFISCLNANGGGIHFLVDKSPNLLVENSIFYNCNATDYGGGIAMYYYGQCIINKVCCESCNAFFGKFLYTQLYSNREFRINYIFESSVFFTDYSEGTAALYFRGGYVKCKMTNVSHCFTDRYSALNIDLNYESIVSYCSLNSNKGMKDGCLYINCYTTLSDVSKNNIIYNTQETNTYGAIICNSDVNITDCCIFKNGNSPFIQANKSNIKIIRCSLDITTTINDSLSSIEFIDIPNDDFVYGFKFYETANCFSSYDSIDDLPVIKIHYPLKNKITSSLSIKYQRHRVLEAVRRIIL